MKVRFIFILVVMMTVFCNIKCKRTVEKPDGQPPPPGMRTKDDYLVRKESVKGRLTSYAGFIDGKNNAKMFFWFFSSESRNSDPLIVWLNGNVGTSTLKSLFENNGPFYVKLEKGTQPRHSYLSQKNNVLYLDTAVGTGYSHTFNKSEPLYPSNMDELVDNIYISLNSFYRVFDYLKNSDLYIGGDGFACHIITKLASRIDQSIKHHSASHNPCKLKGLIIENGICDPPTVIQVGQNLLNLRIVDPMKQSKIGNVENQIATLIQKGQYEDAFDLYDSYIIGLLTPYKTLFNNMTYYESSNNLLNYDDKRKLYGNFSNFIQKLNVKNDLHVPKDLPYDNGKTILKKIRGELMKSSMSLLGELLNKYNVLMYFGQMNPEISPKGAYITGSGIQWCASKFFGISYRPWFLNNHLVGYTSVTQLGDCKSKFIWALVRNAGKNVAGEKPHEITDLINMFTNNTFM